MRHVALLLLLLTAACSTTAVTLPYTPTATVQPAVRPTVAGVNVIDAREEKDPRWIGAIRGGYGNPIKNVTTVRPVKDEVESAFRDALAARGLLAPVGAAYRLDVVVKRLSCNQVARRGGHAIFTVALVDPRSNRTVYNDQAESRVVTGSLITFDAGVFASVDDLREVTVRAMSQAIDQALNKPGFVETAQRLQVAQAMP